MIPLGLEPRTPWLKVKCSTNWATESYVNKTNFYESEISKWKRFKVCFAGAKIVLLFKKKCLKWNFFSSKIKIGTIIWKTVVWFIEMWAYSVFAKNNFFKINFSYIPAHMEQTTSSINPQLKPQNGGAIKEWGICN